MNVSARIEIHAPTQKERERASDGWRREKENRKQPDKDAQSEREFERAMYLDAHE